MTNHAKDRGPTEALSFKNTIRAVSAKHFYNSTGFKIIR